MLLRSSGRATVLGIVAATLLSACSGSSGGGGAGPSPTTTATSQDVTPTNVDEPRRGEGDAAEPGAEVELTLAWKLAVTTAVSYDDVKTTLTTKCATCHRAGGRQPDLSVPPQGATLARIADRMHNQERPMPPRGLLPASEVAPIDQWIAAGAPVTAGSSVSTEGYRLRMRWSASAEFSEVRVDGEGRAATTVRVTDGQPVVVEVEVVAADGTVGARQIIQAGTASAGARLEVELRERARPAATTTATTTSTDTQTRTDATAETDTRVVTSTSTGTSTAVEVSEIPVSLKWQVRLVNGATGPTYTSIRDIIDAKCIRCHGDDGNSPHMASFPFTHDEGRTLAQIVAVIRDRANNAESPMPPRGLLPQAQRDRLNAWLDAGAPGAATAAAVDPSTYSLHFRWSVEGQELSAPVTARLSARGELTQDLGVIATNARLRAVAEVVGPRGTVVLTHTITGIDVARNIALSLEASAEDNSAPTPGARGQLELQPEGSNAATVRWSAASDDRTPASALTYRLSVARTAALGSVDLIERNGTPVGEFRADALSQRLDDLTPGTQYWVNVLVRDELGNTSAYQVLPVQLMTAEQHREPVPGGNLGSEDVTDRGLTLRWAAATDDATAARDLEYLVVSTTDGAVIDTLAKADVAIPVGVFTKDMTARAVKGLIPATRYSFAVIVRDADGNRALYPSVAVTSGGEASGDYDINAYGKECAERLGELKPFNCLDGQIIPITVGGRVPEEGYPEFAQSGSRDLACDKPALLGLGSDGHCPPYARLGRLDSYRRDGSVHPDVDTVFICRRYKGRFGSFPWQGASYEAEKFPGFEDVAIIQHNRKTGETCWFQMLAQSQSKDARRVPPPTEGALPEGSPPSAVSARDFWLPPSQIAGIDCLQCHDSDPWIHSPYVDQVRQPNGQPLVPSDTFGQYRMIGRKFFNNWLAPGRRSHAVATTTLPGREEESCTSCHRIGSRNTCRSFAPQSVGQQTASDASTHARNTFALSNWMPPRGHGVDTPEAWEASAFKRHWESLQDCCSNPNAAGCSRTPINEPPLPFAAE